jgi:hypothetical protein
MDADLEQLLKLETEKFLLMKAAGKLDTCSMHQKLSKMQEEINFLH